MRTLLLTAILALPTAAQVPNTLLHPIPSPPTGVESYARLGSSVATDGAYAVVGAPFNDRLVSDSGVVKVFDAAAGALLVEIPNPAPAASDHFGRSVAISGSKIVVGASSDDTGASNAGSAYVYDLSSATPSEPVVTLNNPDPAANDSFGVSVAISGMRVVIGTPGDDAGATNAGSAYVYDLGSTTPTVPVAALNNPNPADGDEFGFSVAISGSRVVVGAYGDDTGAAEAGSAYTYDLSSATPTVSVVRLNNPDPAASDWFGFSVAISGTRVVVGAYGDDTGATDAGSAYVYDLGSGTPSVPMVTLNNPNTSVFGPSRDYFGFSVAFSGARLVVGADQDDAEVDSDGSASVNDSAADFPPISGRVLDAGSAYVYDLNSSTPSMPVVILTKPSPLANDNFGWAVAISGTRVVVGAANDNARAPAAGSAYVYDLGSATPDALVATLDTPNPVAGDEFGFSVAISGTRVVVGAYQDDTGAAGAGSVYVYDFSGATPSVPVATLNNPGPASGDQFGISVAISGTRVVVGALNDNAGAIHAGSAYVYDLASGTPSEPVVTLNNPAPGSSEHFGNSVAISGTRVAVGAYEDDTGALAAGSCYVYDLGSTTPTVPVATLNNPGPDTSDRFGTSVAISGMRVVIGTPGDDTGASSAGSAYVYDLSSATPSEPVVTLNNPGPGSSDEFGISVAISGTRVVVGALRDDTGASNAGSAYVYDLSSATPSEPVVTLNNPGPGSSDQFGISVAISGMQVVIGAPGDDAGAQDAGSAYVYDLGSATPSVPVATFNKPGPAEGDQFGRSVAVDGTTVAVGTPYDDTVATDKGAAYIFGPHPLDQDSDGLLDAWEQSWWLTTTGHDPLDDDDHDGLVNLLELAFGLNPTLPDGGALPPVMQEGGYLTMTITKQPGVSYEVQSAGTLTPGQPDSFSAVSTTVLINDATTLKVRDNTPFGTPPARFMRLQVTAAP